MDTYKSPDLMNGEKVAFCLKHGEAKERIYTPDSPDLMNGEKVAFCLQDGEAGENTQEKTRGRSHLTG